MEAQIRERQAPPLSLHHLGALIMDTMVTTMLTRPHVHPGLYACVGLQNDICRPITVAKQQH